jgi:hypothetical protein
VTSPDDPARIDRRAAMRAALAGATLAAVNEPPRILSLTVAPDVGQAHSEPCTPGSRTIRHPILEPIRQCWGRWVSDVCADLVAPDAVYGSFTLGLTIGGTDTRGAAGGHATVNVGGLAGNQDCVVNLTADCVPPVLGLPLPAGDVRSPASGTPISRTLTENGTHVLGPWSCTGRWPDSVTVTISCRCP